MLSIQSTSRHEYQKGVVITLVAVFTLFVIGAMAALSIDVVTLYTARSEAQLVADSAALAAARVLANSGATSDQTGNLRVPAQTVAQAVATQVALQNQVAGVTLTSANVTFAFSMTTLNSNPTVAVTVSNINVPTFFARIWGTTIVTVGASSKAEAYNPSTSPPVIGATPVQVAPLCVKPWLLPNMDPSNGSNPIFDPTSGAVVTTTLLGWSFNASTGTQLVLRCSLPAGDCTGPPLPALAWQFYPGDDVTFPHPTGSVPTCSLIGTLTNYQASVAGCIQTPIACNSQVNIDSTVDATRMQETDDAVNCLTNCNNSLGDQLPTPSVPPKVPFQFIAGTDDPLVQTGTAKAGAGIMTSNSLVTVPVFDITGFVSGTYTVTIIGFVQLFLNPDGNMATYPPGIKTTVVNLAGCGSSAVGPPIIGNGASPVAVRLISP